MFTPVTPLAVWQTPSQYFVPDTTQRHPLGLKMDFVDPYWGYAEFVYGKAAAALNFGNVVTPQAASLGTTYDKVTNAANLGTPVLVASNEFAINTYGWFQKVGVCAVKSSATVAALASVGLTAAGVIGAFAAGKQIVNYQQLFSQTGAKALTNTQTFNGYGYLFCPNGYDGWTLGMALSGTGIPASTVVAALGSDGKTVYTGSAIGTLGDKNSTASGAVTVTATYTGYSIGQIDSPFAQGQIT